jgi:hypothetical protein
MSSTVVQPFPAGSVKVLLRLTAELNLLGSVGVGA